MNPTDDSDLLGQFRVMRVCDEPVGHTRCLDGPEAVAAFWQDEVASCPWFDPSKEHLVVIVTTTRITACGWNLVSVGTVNETLFHLREVLRPVIVAAGAGFLIVHNHPSGDPSPSRADDTVTRRLQEAATLFQLRFHDHVIVGHQRHFSMREAGVL